MGQAAEELEFHVVRDAIGVPLGHVLDDGLHLVAGERIRKRRLLPLVANVPDQVVFESMVRDGHVEGTPQHRHAVVDGLHVEAGTKGQSTHDVTGLQSVQGPLAEQ